MFSSPVFYKEVKAQNRQSTTAVFAVHPVCFFCDALPIGRNRREAYLPLSIKDIVSRETWFALLRFDVSRETSKHVSFFTEFSPQSLVPFLQ